MKNQDKVRFAKVMVVLSEIFDQGREPSEFKIEIYFQALSEYEIGVIEKAATTIIKSRVYPAFPKPGEIIQEIEGSKEERAVSAWGEVVEAIKRTGPYQSVCFSDSTIHSVIDFMGGWPATGDWLESELKWKQKEFERLYTIMKDKGNNKKYLPGIQEIENGVKGFKFAPPIMIGGNQKLIEGEITV